MENSLAAVLMLFADAPEGAGTGSGQWLSLLLPVLAMIVLWQLLISKPQRREAARRESMLQALKANDHVVTAGGIYGVVTNVHREADAVTIRVDENNNTRLKVSLSAISRVLGDEPAGEATPKKD